MATESSRRLRDWLALAALLAPTLWLFSVQLGLRVDVENHALKSQDSPEALALARRVEQFGRDITVVVAFQAVPAGSGAITAVEIAALSKLRAEVEALEGVGEVRDWPQSSPGGRVWAVQLDAHTGDFAPAVERLEQTLATRTPPSLNSALTGLPVGEVVIAREVRREQSRVLPLVVAAFVLLLLAYYRHAGLVLAILAPPGVAIVWTSGLYALAGRELDPISVMLQPVLLTVGVAAGVHWIEAYLDERHSGWEARTAASRAVASLRQPALLASLTTVVGFLSLSLNAIPAVIDFGVFAALGVGLTYAIAALLTPVLLGLIGRRVSERLIHRHGVLTGFAGLRAADWLAQRALAIRACAVLIAIGGLAAWTRIEVDNDPQRVLPEAHAFRRATTKVAGEIGGSDVFDVLVPVDSAFANPVSLGLLAAYVVARPGIAGPAGPALHSEGGDWLLRFLLAPSGSALRERLFEDIEAHAAALGAPEVRVTGAVVQVARDSGRLIRSALLGTLSSLAALFLLFWAGFRSLRYAWLAMIPNVLPCIVVYAALALTGRPLSVATAMISSVLLGLIVDDTIHLLHRFRELRAAGADELTALERVFQHAGRAIVITSVVLGLGFAVGLSGRLSTTVEFCGLATVTIVVAFLCDLLLLPALLVRARVPEVHGA